MKIAHLADFHLGHPQYGIEERSFDISHTLRELGENIVKRKTDLVIIAGDIFDHCNPDWIFQLHFRWFLDSMNTAGIKVLGINGNHDKQSSILQLSGFFFIDHADYVGEKLGIKIALHGHLNRKELKQLSEQKLEDVDIRVMHQSCLGFLETIMRPEINKELLDKLTESCRYLALGDLHIHRAMNIKKNNCIVAYPGPIDFLRLKETTDYKYWELEYEPGDGVKQMQSIDITPWRKSILVELDECVELAKKMKDERVFFIVPVDGGRQLEATKLKAELIKNKNHLIRITPKKMEGQLDNVIKEVSGLGKIDKDDFMELVAKDKSMDNESIALVEDLWRDINLQRTEEILKADLNTEKDEAQ